MKAEARKLRGIRRGLESVICPLCRGNEAVELPRKKTKKKRGSE
jgi:hypothetical protein